MNSPKLIIMVGNIGTGKTTTTNKLMAEANVSKTRNIITISMDNLAAILNNKHYGPNIWTSKYFGLYAVVKQCVVREALARGFDVIVDGTHMSKISRNLYIDIAKEFDNVNIDIYLHTYPNGLKRRIADPESKHTSPEKWTEIYNNFANMYEKPALDEGINNIIIVKGIDPNE